MSSNSQQNMNTIAQSFGTFKYNFNTSTPNNTRNAISQLYSYGKATKEIAASQTHTDENWVHEFKSNTKKVAAVASLAIIDLRKEKVKDGGLQYCNLSNEHIKTMEAFGVKVDKGAYNLNTQRGVDSFIQDFAQKEQEVLKNLVNNDTYNDIAHITHISTGEDGKAQIAESVQRKVENNPFKGNEFLSDYLQNGDKSELLNLSKAKLAEFTPEKLAQYQAAQPIIANMQNTSKALQTIGTNKASLAENFGKGYIGGLKSYGRRIIAQSVMDDDMKRGYNITMATVRPMKTLTKATIRSAIKGTYNSMHGYAQMQMNLANVYLRQAEKLGKDHAKYATLMAKAKETRQKAESLDKFARGSYRRYEDLRARKNALKRGDVRKAFSSQKSIQAKNAKTFAKAQTKFDTQKAEAAIKNAKRLKDKKKNSKKLFDLISEKRRKKAIKGVDNARKFATRSEKLLKALADSGKLGALGTKLAGMGATAAGGAATAAGGATVTAGTVATAPVSVPAAGVVGGVVAALAVVIVCCVVVIVLIGFYALHFVSEGTNLQGSMNNINYCQAIANALQYDIGAEYTYIVKENNKRAFLDNIVISKYGIPCTAFVDSASDTSRVWEETDNTTHWINANGTQGDLLFGDSYYIPLEDFRNEVPVSANIIPIMNMMHTKMLDDITYEQWPTALAYCYYMYAMSHDVSKYDHNSINAALNDAWGSNFMYLTDSRGDTTGFKLQKAPSGDPIWYCNNNSYIAGNVKYITLNQDGTYTPTYNDVVNFIPIEGCNNVYYHDQSDDSIYHNPAAMVMASKLKKYIGNDNFDDYDYLDFYVNEVYPNRNNNAEYGKICKALGNDAENYINGINLHKYDYSKYVHIIPLADHMPNGTPIGKGYSSAIDFHTYQSLTGDNQYSVFNLAANDAANAQMYCDHCKEIDYYTWEQPCGGTHKIEWDEDIEKWELVYEWVPTVVASTPYGDIIQNVYTAVDQYQTFETVHCEKWVPNNPAGKVCICEGHCGGHIHPTCDIVTMMTYEGLAQLDNFKTTYFISTRDVMGKDYSQELTKEYSVQSIINGIKAGNDGMLSELMTAYKINNPSTADKEAALLLIALDKPMINDENYTRLLQARYGKMENDLVSQSIWKIYWMTAANTWFMPFPKSPTGFVNYISRKVLYHEAGIVDQAMAKLFPVFGKIADNLGLDDTIVGTTLTAINDFNAAIDESAEDKFSFEGWITYDDAGKPSYSGEIDILKSFYGDYYEDGYAMSFDAWESFEVNFDESQIGLKPPKYIPNGTNYPTQNPDLDTFMQNGGKYTKQH